MKKIDISKIVSPTSKQPFTANSLKFKQDYDAENYAALVKAFITQSTGSYSLITPYVISGCVLSGTYNITAGEIFYGGSFYNVTALSSSINPIRLILATTFDVTADPLTFTDGVDKNVHEIYTYVSTDVATGGILASSLVSVYGTSKIATQLTLATQSTSTPSYVDLTGITYTNTTGVSKKFKLTLKGVLEMFATPALGSAGCAGKVKLINSTTVIDLDICRLNISSIIPGQTVDIFAYVPFSCQTIVTLANNDVVKGQFIDDNNGVTITDVKFLIEEM